MAELAAASESVNFANIKTVGEAAAHTMALAMQNAVSHQNRLNVLAENLLSVAVKGLHEVDPTEAMAQVKQMTGNDLAQQLGQLANMVAQIQQSMKGAQTTPPPTA